MARGNYRWWSADELAAAVNMYRDRVPVKRIARVLGRTRHGVMKRLLRAGVMRSAVDRARLTPRVAELRSAGMTFPAIAKRLGVSACTVLRCARDAGLPAIGRSERGRRANKKFRSTGRSKHSRRMEEERAESLRRGWPPVTARVRRVLEVVEAAGPIPAGEVAASVGVGRTQVNLVIRMAGGLVRRVGGGLGRHGGYLYDLAPAVRQRRQQWRNVTGGAA